MMKTLIGVWDTLFPVDLPYRRMFILVFIWLIVAVLNYIAKKNFVDLHTPIYFPFSVFKISFETSGILYAIIFALLLYFTLKYKLYSNIFNTYILGISMIMLGNMSLGNIEFAFIKPISGVNLGTTGIQYYHDAIKIDSWQSWLSSFNTAQASLLEHTRTHPPGAVLIQNIFFPISKDPLWIGTIFLFLSSISIILVYKIFIEFGKDNFFANKMALLYAVIPSVNIYSLAVIDAIIAMLVNIVILGVIIIVDGKEKKRIIFWGILSAIAMTIASLLTFGTTFLWAVIGVYSLYLFYFHNNKKILIFMSASGILFLMTAGVLYQGYNFNYFESFFTASRLMNPHGYMLFADPLNYFASRVENIFEIAVFLSLGVVAVLTTIKYKSQNDLYHTLAIIAIAILSLMFLAGAFHTGETARACLFIVGFVLIFLKDIPSSLLTSLISFAALQTIIMQVFGDYFW